MSKSYIYTKVSYIILCACLLALKAQAGEILKIPPDEISQTGRYLFFMHGKIVEKKGLPAKSKKYGSYEYNKILKSIANEEFVVLSEARRGGTDIYEYSKKVAEQVNELISKGVPPRNITVSGFSKGGRMTAVVSSLVANKDINYVILAGCRESDISKYDIQLSGRILSIYDKNDDTFGSCDELFATGEGIESKEIVLTIGDGHGVFYRPRKEWIEPVVNWASQ